MICVECKKNPVLIKKSQLCSACYQKQWRQKKNKFMPWIECLDFIKTFNHKDWLYKSITFKLSKTESFIPTFYDAKANIFIEILSKTTLYQKDKYTSFRKLFPKIKLEIRTPSGELFNNNEQEKIRLAESRWRSMIDRCENPNSQNYKNYGNRGIAVCKRWHTFEKFYFDTGDPPKGMSLDRIDNDGNYEPKNWRWATAKEQHENSRNICL